MINKKLALDVINLASETGADFVEIFAENTFTTSINLEGDKVDLMNQSNTSGVGLRLLKGTRSVYGSTSDFSRKGLLTLAKTLSKSFNEKRCIEKLDKINDVKVKNIHSKHTSLAKVDEGEIIDLCKRVSKVVRDYSPEIVRVITGFSTKNSDIEIFNSTGKHFKDKREYGRFFISSMASDGQKMESNFDGPGSQGGWEFFTEKIDLESIAKEHARKVVLMLHAKECPSGKFPVVIGNGWGGVIFHEACGHQLEATSVAKGVSVFSNMKGQQIANECVSAYDDGTISDEWGSLNIDDEGNAPQNNMLIKDGILTGYLVDNFLGRRMGESGNGACRRESYKYEPTSRMSNTYIAPGKSTPEEIIAATKLGIYAVSFLGGSVDPSTGDFNFGCSEAYIIKDGKITEPVRGATLVGNCRDILKKIDMVGNDLKLGQGMCGSISGNIPVNVGQPTIRVSEIVVGGRGGSIDEF